MKVQAIERELSKYILQKQDEHQKMLHLLDDKLK